MQEKEIGNEIFGKAGPKEDEFEGLDIKNGGGE